MSSIATTYWALRRYTEALKLGHETLALRKLHLGPDHPDTLVSMNALANNYAAIGRRDDALKHQEETLKLRKAKLGPDHPDTLSSMNNLANSYAAVGQHADALKLHQDALALMKSKLGPDHSTTLLCMHAMAADLESLNRGDEAIKVIDEVLERAAGKVVDPRLHAGVLHLRLIHFVKANDVAACRARAEMWEKLDRTDAAGLYDAACFRAVTAAVLRLGDPSADAAKKAYIEADRAMVWLQKAVAAGYRDAAQMATDADLTALRGRADFKKLMSELEGPKAKDKK
jgi:tetratricopeptide (TPR) repeat protein